jgi:hypothetical protein
MCRTRFPGLQSGPIFKIGQDRRGSPVPVTVRPWEFADRAAFPYAYRIGRSQRKLFIRKRRGTSRERNDGNEQQESLHKTSQKTAFQQDFPEEDSLFLENENTRLRKNQIS